MDKSAPNHPGSKQPTSMFFASFCIALDIPMVILWKKFSSDEGDGGYSFHYRIGLAWIGSNPEPKRSSVTITNSEKKFRLCLSQFPWLHAPDDILKIPTNYPSYCIGVRRLRGRGSRGETRTSIVLRTKHFLGIFYICLHLHWKVGRAAAAALAKT